MSGWISGGIFGGGVDGGSSAVDAAVGWLHLLLLRLLRVKLQVRRGAGMAFVSVSVSARC